MVEKNNPGSYVDKQTYILITKTKYVYIMYISILYIYTCFLVSQPPSKKYVLNTTFSEDLNPDPEKHDPSFETSEPKRYVLFQNPGSHTQQNMSQNPILRIP